MDEPAVVALERAAMRAWPALETVEDAGWIVRAARGYTRRANCATALGAPGGELAARIGWAEAQLAGRGLPAIFRVPSVGGPDGLDAALAAAGYRRADEAVVMTLELAGPALAPAPGGIDAVALDAWLDLYDRFGGKAGAQREVHRALLEAIPGERLLAAVRADGTPVGCGLAVRDGALLGLFDLGVDPALRGRGHGARLLDGLLRWGTERGARGAYLQVLATNPAIRLYERCGFREAYRYWYRCAGTEVGVGVGVGSRGAGAAVPMRVAGSVGSDGGVTAAEP
jgi:ribosomal protein S18 acetylase RimI-like enzyme